MEKRKKIFRLLYKCFICVDQRNKRGEWEKANRNRKSERNRKGICVMYTIVNLIEPRRQGGKAKLLLRQRVSERECQTRHISDIVITGNGWRINTIYTSHLIKLNWSGGKVEAGERGRCKNNLWLSVNWREKSLLMEPVEFFLAMSSALDVLRWSMRRFGMLNGGTCMLSDENWCLRGRCRSGDGRDRLSNFNLLRCCRSMQSSISWRTCETN